MKMELVQKGDRYFLRKYFLGFIPLYYDSYDCGWWFTRCYLTEEEGVSIMQRIVSYQKYHENFLASPEKVIATYPE
jgi:hypothetical protein